MNTHEKCKEIFLRLFETSDGQNIGCDIWHAFVGGENFDNCIGENFNQLFWTIRSDWFENEAWSGTSTEFYNTTYILWLYLVVARVYEIFDALNPKDNNDMVEGKRMALTTFNEINLWAKFIKHPKEFIFCHWPDYIQEGQSHTKTGDKVIINSAYLKQHYSSEKDTRPVKLKNNRNVVVQYPRLERITEGFVKDFSTFRDFVCKNEMIIERLRKDTNLPAE